MAMVLLTGHKNFWRSLDIDSDLTAKRGPANQRSMPTTVARTVRSSRVRIHVIRIATWT